MDIWTAWTALLEYGITLLSTQLGLSEALAIIAFTLLARLALMPLSFRAAYDTYQNQAAIRSAKPEIERLKEVYKDNPPELAKRTMALYKKRGIKFLGKSMVFNIGSQGVLGLGLFHTLKNMTFSSKFLWITNLAKPDVILALAVGALMFAGMLLMPGSAEQASLLIFLIPVAISVFVLVSFPSAIGIYWAASNFATLGQSLYLRHVVKREATLARD
ncbi:membrane protein insertase YidC [Marinimicrobium sp. ABcell2]|uniref:YidC/Oxa1 family membrane protein insertase n=1 Tax=Marinimicrobium sp. ABcell2 TaxID=3069751 RepID=UPI0027AE9F86|nr:membrane protein insertase YidC [Marinimicrobium sp. ABcell2]MDQ2076259.1 membrane protein insertase YidC [Marinimicrobium sp. ABcell2]